MGRVGSDTEQELNVIPNKIAALIAIHRFRLIPFMLIIQNLYAMSKKMKGKQTRFISLLSHDLAPR